MWFVFAGVGVFAWAYSLHIPKALPSVPIQCVTASVVLYFMVRVLLPELVVCACMFACVCVCVRVCVCATLACVRLVEVAGMELAGLHVHVLFVFCCAVCLLLVAGLCASW